MKKFSEAGFKTGIINMPIIPCLSDSEKEIEEMVNASKNYGAHYVLYGGLTLYGNAPDDCKTLYFNFLKKNYPDFLPEYENLFNGSIASSKRYQNNLTRKFGKVSRKYGVKNSII